MILETTIIVSRRDAETNPVIHVRDKYTFNTPEEQEEFTEECLLWMDDRPVAGEGFKPLSRKRYRGEAELMSILEELHGPDELWEGYVSKSRNGGRDAVVFDYDFVDHVGLVK